MPQTLLRQARNPNEICLAVALVVVALSGLLFGPLSESLRDGLSFGQQVSWSSLVMGGATLSLVGTYWKSAFEGVKIERAGQFMLSFGALAHSTLLMSESGFDNSGVIIIITAGIALGAGLRVAQITRGIRRLTAAVTVA